MAKLLVLKMMMMRWAAVGLMGAGVLLGVAEPGLGQMRLTQAEASSEVGAIEPFTIEGTLDESNFRAEQGLYLKTHTFTGHAGQHIRIEITSDDIVPMLVLLPYNKEILAGDRNNTNSSTAQIVVTLPSTGTYAIVVGAREIGRYTLSLQPASSQEVAVAEQLTEAEQLSRQVLELFQQSHYADAIPLAQRALAIRETVLGTDHPDVATSLNNLAGLYHAQGNYGQAEPLWQRALQILETALGTHHPDVALGLNNLAELYRAQGNYGQAEPLFQRALQIWEIALGPDHPEVATSLNNLALLYQAQGQYGQAEPLYQRVLQIWETALGPDHPDVALSLNNLASLYQAQGNYGQAEPLYQRALQIRETALSADHPKVATSLDNLASLYQAQGNYGQAEPLYQRAFQIWETALGADHPDVAINLKGLASLYQAQGNYGQAEPLYQRALQIYETAFGADHPDVATGLNNLAGLYLVQGDYSQAESLYQRVLQIYETALGADHPYVATGLNNLAILYLAQDSYEEAIPSFQAGFAIEERNLDLNLATLTEAQRQDYAAILSGSSNMATSLVFQAPNAKSLGLTTLLRRKGRLLDAGSSSWQRLRQNLTPADQTMLDEFIAVQQQLATLTFNPPPNLPPDQYRQQLAQLETQATNREKTLAQRSAVFRVEAQPIEIAAVQAQIPPNGVLIEYARYHPFDAQADGANQWGDPRYAAYLLFPDGRIEVIDLGDAFEIDAAVQSFVGLLQNRSAGLQRTGAAPTIRTDVVDQVTSNINALVFDPIAPYLQDTDHLLISPDGQLNLLPFEALQSEAGGDYLIQQYQISYLNSGRDLLKFDLIEPSTNPAVIVANPDYEVADPNLRIASNPSTPPLTPPYQGGEPSFPPLQGGTEGGNATSPNRVRASTNRRSTELSQLQEVGPLPGTKTEAEAIRPLFPNADIRTEDEATENLLKSVQSPRILHIATHGFFLPDVERPETQDLSNVSTLSDDRPFPTHALSENPLLRSGLALAGFNTRTSGSEDGVFTALEASQLNLFGTQLVVLSACETGLGDIANGEGVYGLRRAFALAGAETQLMSLWQVSDYGTQSLMARYYEKLTAGMGRSEALREVQLEMIEQGGQYSHPYYWAAFILAGDWRSLE